MKMQSIKSFAHGLKMWTTKNSPVILAGLGVAGLIGTGVAVWKATRKASNVITRKRIELASEQASTKGFQYDYDHNVISKDLAFKMTWRYYIPAVILGAGSIACIIGGTVQGQKRLAALSALYSMSQEALKEYQEAAKEIVGEKNAEKIKSAVQDDHMNKADASEDLVIITGHGNTLFYDDWNGRFFRSDIDFVKRMVNEMNAQLFRGAFGVITLNEFYETMDLPLVRYGSDVGWDGSEAIELSYDARLNQKQEPAIVIEFTNWPKGFSSSDWNGI